MSDNVNRPAHYVRGGLEAIDVIEAFDLDFRIGNAVKYLLRAGHKGNRLEDLAKARWYIDRAIEMESISHCPGCGADMDRPRFHGERCPTCDALRETTESKP